MKQLLALLTIIFFHLFAVPVEASPEREFPVLYKGRFRPAEAYARLWLYEFYHSPSLKEADLPLFDADSSSPLSLLWSLNFFGYLPYQKAPLFWIGSAETKRLADLPLTRNRFSYRELDKTPFKNPEINQAITGQLIEFEHLHPFPSPMERAFQECFLHLQKKGLPAKEIERILEQEYPIMERLKAAGSLFKCLPGRYPIGEWFPIHALKAQIYDPSSQTLKLVGNFTLYSDQQFNLIRKAYWEWENSLKNSNQAKQQENQQQLTEALQQAYKPLAGQVYREAHGKQLLYPTLTQLKVEALYVSYPWIPLLIALYGLGACLLMLSSRLASPSLHGTAIGVIGSAFLCHSALLAMRCYILGRPPVSNMFETVIYVPWVAAAMSLLIPPFRRQTLVLLSACFASIGLLVLLEVTDLNQSLDQVQAVLDSQFWLMIHVLLVVGSYGIFILGALLGHLYLGLFLFHRLETERIAQLAQIILQTMYAGTALLVTGTILGGIWAAESWGRFWDWDPKESWAFISSCLYLLWIHAYRFHRIASFGLAVGAVSGALVISFTWYGVNYILGTGLHSYGFGSGGEGYYYSFIGAECLFLALSIGTHLYRRSSILS